MAKLPDGLRAQQPIGRMRCPDCGANVVIKLNKNANAYYSCMGGIEDKETADILPCSSHRRWGRHMSRQLIADYLKSQKPANDNRPPQPPKADAVKPAKPEVKDNGQSAKSGRETQKPSDVGGNALGRLARAVVGNDWD